MNHKQYKRLSMNLPMGVHENIRLRANARHITITRYVLRCIIENIVRNQEDVAADYVNK